MVYGIILSILFTFLKIIQEYIDENPFSPHPNSQTPKIPFRKRIIMIITISHRAIKLEHSLYLIANYTDNVVIWQ